MRVIDFEFGRVEIIVVVPFWLQRCVMRVGSVQSSVDRASVPFRPWIRIEVIPVQFVGSFVSIFLLYIIIVQF